MDQNEPAEVVTDEGAAAPATAPVASVTAAKAAAERRCIISGEHGERADLIRLALDADGAVAPDLGARAPGRGAWVTPDRELIAKALAKGKLKGALIRAFKTSQISVPDDLVERIDVGLERRALDTMGLANKAGTLIWGGERIGDALTAGRARLLLHANDAAADGTEKLRRKARGIATIQLPISRERLSLALGRENVVHAAVCDSAAAARVTAAVERWLAFTGLGETKLDAPEDTPPADTTRVSG